MFNILEIDLLTIPNSWLSNEHQAQAITTSIKNKLSQHKDNNPRQHQYYLFCGRITTSAVLYTDNLKCFQQLLRHNIIGDTAELVNSS